MAFIDFFNGSSYITARLQEAGSAYSSFANCNAALFYMDFFEEGDSYFLPLSVCPYYKYDDPDKKPFSECKKFSPQMITDTSGVYALPVTGGPRWNAFFDYNTINGHCRRFKERGADTVLYMAFYNTLMSPSGRILFRGVKEYDKATHAVKAIHVMVDKTFLSSEEKAAAYLRGTGFKQLVCSDLPIKFYVVSNIPSPCLVVQKFPKTEEECNKLFEEARTKVKKELLKVFKLPR